MPSRIQDLILHMPKTLIADGVQRWIFELALAGKQEMAEEIFMKFQKLKGFEQQKANAGAFLVARSVFSKNVLGALRLYECLRRLGDGPVLTGIRLKACNILIHYFLPENLEAAVGLWQEFASLPLTESQQWQWALSGVDVIGALLEQGERAEAEAAFQTMAAKAVSSQAQGTLAEAEKLLGREAE